VILVEEVRTTTRGRRATRRSAASPAEKKPTRHIYRLGQSVEKTGYTVKEIEMTRVVLAKGDEERVLELESGDAGSEKRVKSAVAAADKARAAAPARKSTKTDSASTAPAPPPPPPMPTGIVPAGTGRTAAKTTSGTRTTSTQLSKEERVRRALEARRRLLEERKKKSNQ